MPPRWERPAAAPKSCTLPPAFPGWDHLTSSKLPAAVRRAALSSPRGGSACLPAPNSSGCGEFQPSSRMVQLKRRSETWNHTVEVGTAMKGSWGSLGQETRGTHPAMRSLHGASSSAMLALPESRLRSGLPGFAGTAVVGRKSNEGSWQAEPQIHFP